LTFNNLSAPELWHFYADTLRHAVTVKFEPESSWYIKCQVIKVGTKFERNP